METAELAADPAAPVAELAADPAAEVMLLRADPGAPTADESCPRMEETTWPWAETPAARRVVATMEKRIWMVCCWLIWVGD